MTDIEIIKALECCSKNPLNCRECGYKGKCNRIDCYDYLKRDALDLIKRQKAENERLKSDLHDCVREVSKSHEIDKNKAIIEFAERLKETGARNNAGLIIFVESNIDNLVKEMVGEC